MKVKKVAEYNIGMERDMASWFGDANDNTIDWSSHGLAFNETGHLMSGMGGNDFITGGNKNLIGGAYIGTTLDGGAGDDVLVAQAGDDVLLGGIGDDQMFGGAGTDLLIGGAGNDQLAGEGGNNDRLSGGTGNDTYYFMLGDDGRGDIVNDDMSATWTPGFGGGNDRIELLNTTLDGVIVARVGDDLLLSRFEDILDDGQANSYVTVEGFFLQGQGFIEEIGLQDTIIAGTDLVAIVPNDGNFYFLT